MAVAWLEGEKAGASRPPGGSAGAEARTVHCPPPALSALQNRAQSRWKPESLRHSQPVRPLRVAHMSICVSVSLTYLGAQTEQR